MTRSIVRDSDRYILVWYVVIYEGIASIDLFTEYFHFNVMPCCFRCYSGFENSLSWPQWNDCIMHACMVCMLLVYSSQFVFRVRDCYNGWCTPIACVVNIWLYHWLLICRAMLDKIQRKSDWNRFGLTSCGRHLICNQHRIFHVRCSSGRIFVIFSHHTQNSTC